MKLLLGRKLAMTRIYDEAGRAQAVTVVQAGPCVVTQLKRIEPDGYTAVQLGFGERRHVTQPVAGHLKNSGRTTVAALKELRLTDPSQFDHFKIGQTLDVTMFSPGETVMVSGTSKGKGYAGVMKRHGFAGGPASHGSHFHRAPGSIGAQGPQRTIKGTKLPGQMGAERVSVKGLKVLQVDPERHLLAIAGAIPGPKRAIVEVRSHKSMGPAEPTDQPETEAK